VSIVVLRVDCIIREKPERGHAAVLNGTLFLGRSANWIHFRAGRTTYPVKTTLSK